MSETLSQILILILAGIGFVIVIGALSVLMGYPTMLLWNYFVPEVLGLKAITWYQAIALNGLCGILFKSNSSSSSK